MQQKKRTDAFHRLQRCLWGVLLTAVLLFSSTGMVEAMAQSQRTLQLEYICAWMSLASYGDRIGVLAKEELEASGWNIETVHEKKQAVDAKYLVAGRRELHDKPVYLVTVTGTSNMKDVKIDLSFAKAYFAGETPEDFAEMANKPDVKEQEPQVHRGFNTYTQQAFFQPGEDGISQGEKLRDLLVENPEARVVLTGHSLGGAVAVVLGQRLIDMGAPPEQLRVVTFGAPPVGNAAFAEHCSQLQLDRVVMAKDPVVKIPTVQFTGLEHFGNVTELKRSASSKRFRHAMAGYLDAVLKSYYDSGLGEAERPEWLQAEALLTAPIYLVQTTNLPELIAEDAPYMKLATADLISRQFSEVVRGEQGSLKEILLRAKKAGCKYIIMQEYSAQRCRDKDYEFTVTLQETVLDQQGSLLTAQSFTTSTNQMSPVGAALYNEVQGRAAREAVILH